MLRPATGLSSLEISSSTAIYSSDTTRLGPVFSYFRGQSSTAHFLQVSSSHLSLGLLLLVIW